MQADEQIHVIEGLMQHPDRGTNVDAGGQVRNPVSSYTCPDRLDQQWQSFCRNYPQVLGLTTDLAKPGSFFTSTDLGKPVLCIRDETGAFHALLNVCRHRGTIVESEIRGKKVQFNCSFHVCGYNHQGAPVAVPKEDHFGPIDRSAHGLVRLPAVERYGDVKQRMQSFAEIIRDEDYVAAAQAHQGALSGAQEYVIFGRNELALHHYQNTYRQALGLPPLEVVSN